MIRIEGKKKDTQFFVYNYKIKAYTKVAIINTKKHIVDDISVFNGNSVNIYFSKKVKE